MIFFILKKETRTYRPENLMSKKFLKQIKVTTQGRTFKQSYVLLWHGESNHDFRGVKTIKAREFYSHTPKNPFSLDQRIYRLANDIYFRRWEKK